MPPNVTDAQFLEPNPNAIGGPWALMISAHGDGFIGFLAATPEDGTVLSIGYEELAPTSVVFHAGAVA